MSEFETFYGHVNLYQKRCKETEHFSAINYIFFQEKTIFGIFENTSQHSLEFLNVLRRTIVHF